MRKSPGAERRAQAKSGVEAEGLKQRIRFLWDKGDRSSGGTGSDNQSRGDQFSRRLLRSETVVGWDHSTIPASSDNWRSSLRPTASTFQPRNDRSDVSIGGNEDGTSSSSTRRFGSNWRSSSLSTTPVAQGQSNSDTTSAGGNQGRASSATTCRTYSTSTTPAVREPRIPDEFPFGRNRNLIRSTSQGLDDSHLPLFGRNPDSVLQERLSSIRREASGGNLSGPIGSNRQGQ